MRKSSPPKFKMAEVSKQFDNTSNISCRSHYAVKAIIDTFCQELEKILQQNPERNQKNIGLYLQKFREVMFRGL